jgi:hypothetical protein
MKISDSRFYSKLIQKLGGIGEKQGKVALKDLASELELPLEDTLIFLRGIFPEGKGVEVYWVDERCWVDIDASALNYMLPLRPSEWLALNELFSQLDSHQITESKELERLKKKITTNGPMKSLMMLLEELNQWDLQLNENLENILTQLDLAINSQTKIQVQTIQKKSYSLYPLKTIHLEGKLSLIAEDAQDHCMVIMAVEEITVLEMLTPGAGRRVSSFEVEEFIKALRVLNETEVRLILKIHDPESANLFPDHHFLGRPYMVANPQGDLIWAAYVEPCSDLFEWLISLEGKVEILDPVKFKDEYLRYCEEKLRKIA